MAEQIDIASLNFDTDKLMDNLLETRQRMDELKGSIGELRKESRESKKSVDEQAAAVKKLADEGKSGTKEFENAEKKLSDLTDEYNNSTKAILKQEQEVRGLSKEQRDLTKILDAQSKATENNTDAIDRAVKSSQEEIKTVDQARASNTQLLKLRNSLDIAGGKNADKLAELNNALNQNNKFIKDNVSAYEQQKIEIGDYANQIGIALGGTKLFGVSLTDVKGVATQFTGVFSLMKAEVAQATEGFKTAKAATERMNTAQKMGILTTNGLTVATKLFRVALISTGIGAIVVALGSLIAYLSTTQAGIDAVTSVTRPLSAVFQTLLGIIQQFGGELFNDPIKKLKEMKDFVVKQLVESFTGLGKIIAGIFTLDKDKINEGADQIKKLADDNAQSLKNFAKGIGDQFDEAYKKGKQIDALQKEQERLEGNIASERAKATDELRKQENIYKDQTLSMEDRNAAAEESGRIALDLQAKENKILDVQIQQLQIKQSLNDTSREDLRLLDELIARRIDSNAKVDEVEKKTLGLRKQMQAEAAAAQKEASGKAQAEAEKRIDEALALQKIQLDTMVLLGEKSAEGMEEELEFAREVSNKKLEILKAELAAKKITQEAYEFQVLSLGIETAKEQNEIALFYATQRANDEILKLQELQAEKTRVTLEGMASEKAIIDEIEAQESANALAKLEAGLIDRRAYNDEIANIEIAKNARIKEIDDEFAAQQKADRDLARMLENESILLNLTDRWEQRQEIEQQQYEAEFDKLEEQKEAGLISEANYLLAIENLNKKHAAALTSIDAERQKNKVALASNALGQMSSIMGEETEAGKFFAIAQATIDTYTSAVSAFNSLSSIPIVGPVLGAIASAAAIAMGLKSVQKIKGTSVSKYGGGYTGDGGMFNPVGDVHAGEVVFSQADVQAMGGASRVESMRPTSELYGSMPTGVQQQSSNDEMWRMVGDILGEKVKEGSEKGTNTGMVEAGENENVRTMATF